MAPDPDVRLAGPRDQVEVCALIAGFRDFYGEDEPSDEQVASMVAELIEDRGTEFLLAAEPAVGLAQVRFRRSVWTGAEDAWLEDLFVAAAARRRGPGAGAGLHRAGPGAGLPADPARRQRAQRRGDRPL